MQKGFLIVCVIISICSCKQKSVWTKQYERRQYREIDLGIKPSFPDETKRKELVSFIIKRLKLELPAGVESVPIDSLKRLSSNLAKEYAYTHKESLSVSIPHRVVWSTELETNIKEAFLKDVSIADREMQTKGCDCIIAKLKTIYPDSAIVPFPKDTLSKVAIECRNELVGNSVK
jgi:hypothetical protein